MKKLIIASDRSRQVIDITDKVQTQIPAGHSGAAAITILHTTAALTTADLDPGTDQDLLDALSGLLPERQWRHPHNPSHAPDHLLSSIIGPSVVVPVERGSLVLGDWQRVILVELDGPRLRTVVVTLI